MDNRSGETDAYNNDGNVSHTISKEERESGKNLEFLGNWKWVFKPDAMRAAPPAPKVTAASQGVPLKAAEDDDELPF